MTFNLSAYKDINFLLIEQIYCSLPHAPCNDISYSFFSQPCGV